MAERGDDQENDAEHAWSARFERAKRKLARTVWLQCSQSHEKIWHRIGDPTDIVRVDFSNCVTDQDFEDVIEAIIIERRRWE